MSARSARRRDGARQVDTAPTRVGASGPSPDTRFLGWAAVIGGAAQATYVLLPMFGVGSLGASVTFESAEGPTLFGILVSLALAALAAVVFGVLALRGSRHAWRLGIIILAFNAVWAFMAVFIVGMRPAAIALIASVGLVVYLGARPVRESFGVEGDLTAALWYRR
jgi:hypothetical protein